MRQDNHSEFWGSLAAILLITLVYLLVMNFSGSIPAASSLFGHAIGIVGFLLMLTTEVLYSYRKRTRRASWGPMSSWLKFHIFTGLVGPYMVLLHTSWKFNGLAGVVMLLTILIVASGFIGRYIYTAVPRSVDGVAVEREELESRSQAIEEDLRRWREIQPEAAHFVTAQLASTFLTQMDGTPQAASSLILGRFVQDWKFRWQWSREKRKLPLNIRSQLDQLERLQMQKNALQRQVASLVMARRTLSLWHNIHIPIGMALFTAAFIHVAAVLYYVTLAH